MLSIWQDSVCRATLRLAPSDVAQVVAMLTRTAVDTGEATQPDELGSAG